MIVRLFGGGLAILSFSQLPYKEPSVVAGTVIIAEAMAGFETELKMQHEGGDVGHPHLAAHVPQVYSAEELQATAHEGLSNTLPAEIGMHGQTIYVALAAVVTSQNDARQFSIEECAHKKLRVQVHLALDFGLAVTACHP